jgi:hypothetical protein
MEKLEGERTVIACLQCSDDIQVPLQVSKSHSYRVSLVLRKLEAGKEATLECQTSLSPEYPPNHKRLTQ